MKKIGSMVKWTGGFGSALFCNTADAELNTDSKYEVLDVDVTDNTILLMDDFGDDRWVNTEDFEVVVTREYFKALEASSKNFAITINGDIFKVEAIGLSEEKINKIMDILCK